jgi:hypothetical protein
MKAVMEFNLPEDEYEYECAINAKAYRDTLYQLYQRLRNEMKYKEIENSEHYMELFWEVLNNNNVVID